MISPWSSPVTAAADPITAARPARGRDLRQRLGERVERRRQRTGLVRRERVNIVVAVADRIVTTVLVERRLHVGEPLVELGKQAASPPASRPQRSVRRLRAGEVGGEVREVGVAVPSSSPVIFDVDTSFSNSTAPLAICAGSSSTVSIWVRSCLMSRRQLVGDRAHAGHVVVDPQRILDAVEATPLVRRERRLRGRRSRGRGRRSSRRSVRWTRR